MRKIILIIFLIVIFVPVKSNAGRFRDWCERHLVAPDPYDYEVYTDDALWDNYIDEAMTAIAKRRQSSDLRVMGNELRKRGVGRGDPFFEQFQKYEYPDPWKNKK